MIFNLWTVQLHHALTVKSLFLAAKFTAPPNVDVYTEDEPGLSWLLGEDPEEQARLRPNEFTQRILTGFTIFDTTSDDSLVSLTRHTNDEDTKFGAAGIAMADFEDGEDAGQNDWEDKVVIYLRIQDIRYEIDYKKIDGCVPGMITSPVYTYRNIPQSYQTTYRESNICTQATVPSIH